MTAQAIYRRWRPRRFADVVGQEHVTRTLRNAVKNDRVAHGYLFSGPRGVAKTSTARVLAKAINCLDSTDGEPCDACVLCRAIGEGTSYDVIEMDAASNGLVENVRELRQNVLTHPDQARRKVYILDEAHRMSGPAFDALLKTLEEPPAHVVFVLVTSEPDKIPATIASRCQRFDFRRLPQRGIVGRLREICETEKVDYEPSALEAIARAATGSMRDAQSLLDQLFAMGGDRVSLGDVEAVLGTAGLAAARQLASHVIRREQASGLHLISQVIVDGADPRQFCRDVADYLRGLLLIKLAGPDDALDLSAETLAEMTDLAREAGLEHLLAAVRIFGQADAGWRGTLHFQLPLELAFVDATLVGAPTSAATAGSMPSQPTSTQVPSRLLTRPAQPPVTPGATPPAARATVAPPPRRPEPTAEPEQPIPVSSAAAPRAQVDPGDLRRLWDEIKRNLSSTNSRLAAFLTDVRPAGLEGDRLTLHARTRAHADLVKRDLRLLMPELHRGFGQGIAVSVTVAERWEALPDEAPDPVLGDPVVRKALDRGWRARVVPVQSEKGADSAAEHEDAAGHAAKTNEDPGGAQ